MTTRKRLNVLEGSIKKHLLRMAIPSIGGMFAITIFNLTDTYFVSKLGTDALAAMGFTFPVIMFIGTVSRGISMGAASVLARAMGKGDHHKTHRIATDGILLSLLMVLFISIFGLFYLEEIFRALGAKGKALKLVQEYMNIWFACAVAAVVPPVSDSSMRALGDMVRPFLVMLSVAILNIILDPILIFGLFGFPAMGMKGAAIATAFSRTVGGIISLCFLGFHYKLLNFRYRSLFELIESWKDILIIGIPNILTRLLPQTIRISITRLTADTVGTLAIAAIAAGQRIESFAVIASMGVGVAIIPIIGQNYGKGQTARVMETRKLLIHIAFLYGFILFVIMLPFGKVISRIFTDNPKVLELTTLYIQIIMIGTIGENHYNWLSESFNAVGKPKYALIINTIGTLCIILPLLFIGSKMGNFTGILIGLVLGQIITGVMAIWISAKYLIK